MINLSGKTILVTGGSRGIGAAIVESVAAAGAKVILHYASNRRAAESVQARIGADNCRLVAADLASAVGAADLWHQAAAVASEIDVLINNAGIYVAAPIESAMDEWQETWARVMQVNLFSPADLCKLAILHFRARGRGGKIINIASRAAHRGDAPDHAPYAASKGGLVALTKTIARGYARDNILAFAIAPGFTDTEMAYVGLDDAGVERVVSEIPLGTMASPDECGALAAFLCSDKVRHLTGATFDINGASYVR